MILCVSMQWLPYDWRYQLIYIAYRWALVLYFFIWLVIAGKSSRNSYFIYLTNWAHLAFNSYLIISALSSSFKLAVTRYARPKGPDTPAYKDNLIEDDSELEGYWNVSKNTLSWYQIVHWVSFTLGIELAFGVMVLYWTLDYNSTQVIDGVNVNTHLLNGILALVDVWISGTPVRLLHCLYLMLFSFVYGTFSGVYYISTGRNIYAVLDYRSNTGAAVGLNMGIVFVFLPLLHLCVYLLSMCRRWLVRWARTQVQRRVRSGSLPISPSDMSDELTEMKTLAELDNDSASDIANDS